MRGASEVQQFLQRQHAEQGWRDSDGVPAQRSGAVDAPRVSDDQVRRARLAVAAGAVDLHDCAQLLDMLGLVAGEGDDRPPVQD